MDVDLQALGGVSYDIPAFDDLSEFSVSRLIYHDDMSSLWHGTFRGNPAIVESCVRIPFSMVCREVAILRGLAGLPGIPIIQGMGWDMNTGVVTIAYENYRVVLDPVPVDKGPGLFWSLVRTLRACHEAGVTHGWVDCHSVLVLADFEGVMLGRFHAAVRGAMARPFRQHGSMGDLRLDDFRDAARWVRGVCPEIVMDREFAGVLAKADAGQDLGTPA